jgi:hypothetical protein
MGFYLTLFPFAIGCLVGLFTWILTRDPLEIVVSVSGTSRPSDHGHSGFGSNNTGILSSIGPTLIWQETHWAGEITMSLFVVLSTDTCSSIGLSAFRNSTRA